MGTLDSFRKKILPGGSATAGDLPDNEQPRPDGGSDAKVRSMEVDERRKRDRILRMIGGRRGQGVGVSEGRDSAQKQQGGEMKGHRDFSEGTHVRGEEDTGDEDQDGGEYVNFAVDFSYDGRKNRNGWDLHFLCYMGIGMKGLGGGELREQVRFTCCRRKLKRLIGVPLSYLGGDAQDYRNGKQEDSHACADIPYRLTRAHL
jgi:hypothetical protein